MSNSGMRPIHPGEILEKEFLEPLGITADALARSLNEVAGDVRALVMQEGGISPELAKKLSLCLKTTPEFWLNLQSAYDQRRTEIERG
ncbi:MULTISPECIES: HigA family addiction module antitoxin [Pseudomonas]|uniref:HigA family addiction module antitoxin n=1 Tax=Pseudomonas wuhanensis TaxID=2954098 RepID=A0ABY9GSQ7_9PSED|nr:MULTISPECIES: HigA family addiction module antitoxin [unclassified Pseudomonas]WLI12805.1 HigA family addiction module antitoxin [Pseudomonas sp. FP603]WLI18683.1 HigA family addiction module antitoxin [Pseudomonas sp. FP607]